jgi:hypothetical protein
MACSRGEVVEGALHRRLCAPGVGGIEDLKRVSGKNLLSVEWAARVSGENLLSVEWAAHTPDIYIGGGGQMHDACSLRRVAHFLGMSCIIFR